MDLHIFDRDCKEKCTPDKININWDGKELNSILEDNKKELRSKYLNIINKVIKNNSLKFKYFRLNNLCLIKMSLINEKNPFKSNGIYNCLKLLALEKILQKNHINTIYYNGKDFDLNKSLELLSANYGLIYKNKKIINIFFRFKIFEFLKGNIFFFTQLIKNFNLSKNTKNYSNNSIFSYFVHFTSIKNKKFQSNLWGDLPNYLNYKKKYINWFHFYVPSNEVKNSKIANLIKKKFNLNNYENHNFINSYMDLNDFLKSYKIFLIYFIKNLFKFNSNLIFFNNKYSKTNFCFFLKNDFNSSFFGSSLVYNIMNIQTFDNLLKKIPKQKHGLYIIENQSWEYCFIKLWRKYNHGKLTSYFNSSMRYWDLRYLKNENDFKIHDENPDKYLINNYIVNSETKEFGYPMNKVYKTEALRYKKLKPIKKIKKNKKILIVGDILFNETVNLLDFINNTVDELKSYKFYLKPHPTMTISSIKYLLKNYIFLKIVNINSNSFKNFEFIICSNGTSANLDCMIMKLNFCSIKTLNTLNLFPIEKFEKIFQIENHKELVNRIKSSKKNYLINFTKNKIKSKDFKTLFL
mgnify:CR=1 FL=1|tara:strand:- start:545 stop:2278 length:1734 start_codon:yes stop_codon:yes gene_type:complete